MGDIDIDKLLAERANAQVRPDGTYVGAKRRGIDNGHVKDAAYLAHHAPTGPPVTPIAAITRDLEQVDIRARVDRLDRPTARQVAAGIRQVGQLTDASGSIRFSSWNRGEPPELEEGAIYVIEGAQVTHYMGVPQLELDAATRASGTALTDAEDA